MGFLKVIFVIITIPCIYSGMSSIIDFISKSFDA